MKTISILYRCLITIFLFIFNFSQWLHQGILQFISRNRYTVTVNIDVIRNDLWNVNYNEIDKIQFSKPTEVLALIINERIPDINLYQFIINIILFFRKLNIRHLIIYDYEGKNERKINLF